MNFGLIPSISCLIFIIIMSLVYFKKKRTNNALKQLYSISIIITILLVIIQMIYTYIINNLKLNTLATILIKINFSLEELCISIITLILIIIIKKINVNKIKELYSYTKKIKTYIIVSIILSILILIVPPYKMNIILNNKIQYSNILNSIYIIIYLIYYYILMIIVLKNNNKESEKKYKNIILFIILLGIIISILQLLYNEISFIPIYYSICLYILYYSYLNPDIELLNEINIARIDIDKSTNTKTNFLSNITSEMKNPLEIITSTCNSLIHYDDLNNNEAKTQINQIVVSGINLIDIVSNIVDVSKSETSKTGIKEVSYNIKTIVNDLKELAINKIGNKKIEFIVNLDENISSELYGDITKINITLTNLITNAVKYTEVGKITFTISSQKELDFETLLFKVSDTGDGIKEEEQSKIFQKGVRLSNSIENEIDGSGLGLSLSKEQIELIGGKIWFKSEYRVGTTFFVEIKQKILDKTPIKDAVSNISTENTPLDCSNYKLLIVDDNKPNIKVIKRLLEKYKFQIDYAVSGKDCINKIKNDEKFDIIFMDHFMPELDGVETIKALKQLDGYKIPPIVCVTANSLSGMKESYLKEGFDDFIAKPINVKELDKVIRKFFSSNKNI